MNLMGKSSPEKEVKDRFRWLHCIFVDVLNMKLTRVFARFHSYSGGAAFCPQIERCCQAGEAGQVNTGYSQMARESFSERHKWIRCR